jgi:hypothetical protein
MKMIENMVPVTLAQGSTLPLNQPHYPIQEASEQDVLKFKLELGVNGKVPPVFEATDKVATVEAADRTVLGLLQKVDSNYHSVLTNMNELTSKELSLRFKSLPEARNEVDAVRIHSSSDIKGDEFVRTSDDLGSGEKAVYKEMLLNQEENQVKALEMMHDMTNKTIGAQMFMSNVKVISAAISQLSQGFKTLFRSSG